MSRAADDGRFFGSQPPRRLPRRSSCSTSRATRPGPSPGASRAGCPPRCALPIKPAARLVSRWTVVLCRAGASTTAWRASPPCTESADSTCAGAARRTAPRSPRARPAHAPAPLAAGPAQFRPPVHRTPSLSAQPPAINDGRLEVICLQVRKRPPCFFSNALRGRRALRAGFGTGLWAGLTPAPPRPLPPPSPQGVIEAGLLQNKISLSKAMGYHAKRLGQGHSVEIIFDTARAPHAPRRRCGGEPARRLRGEVSEMLRGRSSNSLRRCDRPRAPHLRRRRRRRSRAAGAPGARRTRST